MSVKTILAGTLLTAVAVSSAVTFATPNRSWYGTIGAGWAHTPISKSDLVTPATKIDRDHVGYRAGLGYKVNENFAAELDYLHFGRAEYKSTTAASDGEVKTQALALNAVGILPITDQFSANVKLGVFRSWVDRDSVLIFTSGDKPEGEFGVDYGLALQYEFTPEFGVSVNWEQLLRHPRSGLLSGNLVFNFG